MEQTRNAYDGIDLPKEMIKSLGKGPRTSDGFRTSPVFQLYMMRFILISLRMTGSSSRGSTTSIPQFISISMSCKNSKMLLRRKLCDYGESDVR